MMPAFIFVFSVATLLMFFISYCRAMTASSSRHALSEEVRDVTGIGATASGRDYTRVVQLLQLCPERPDENAGLRSVGIYYAILNFAQSALNHLPSFSRWAEAERAKCAYYAAVALDRRIAFSREILARQAEF